jgi:hypothetical protein
VAVAWDIALPTAFTVVVVNPDTGSIGQGGNCNGSTNFGWLMSWDSDDDAVSFEVATTAGTFAITDGAVGGYIDTAVAVTGTELVLFRGGNSPTEIGRVPYSGTVLDASAPVSINGGVATDGSLCTNGYARAPDVVKILPFAATVSDLPAIFYQAPSAFNGRFDIQSGELCVPAESDDPASPIRCSPYNSCQDINGEFRCASCPDTSSPACNTSGGT